MIMQFSRDLGLVAGIINPSLSESVDICDNSCPDGKGGSILACEGPVADAELLPAVPQISKEPHCLHGP